MASTYYADFETSVYKNQTFTEVWCGAIVEHGGDKPILFRSMDDFIFLIDTFEYGSKIYFQNLKFDGSFIIDYLERHRFEKNLNEEDGKYKWNNSYRIPKFTYSCYINRKGIWYDIRVRTKHSLVIIKDSLKILPFSVSTIAKNFNTAHKKTEIVYDGVRTPFTKMTDKEKDYVKNDVMVVNEAMVMFRSEGHTADTIGGCALSNFIKIIGRDEFRTLFPPVYEQKIDEEEFGWGSVGDYVLKSYSGAFVCVNPYKEKRVIKNGHTLDVTSLYPSRMHSSGVQEYPTGYGHMEKGRGVKEKGKYFFQRFRCEFNVKDGYLPFIKIRHSYLYNPRECLSSSSVTSKEGLEMRNKVVLTLTQTELELFLEHYDVVDMEYLDYCWFYTREKLFDDYVNYWIDRKNNAENKAKRTIAKLFLNSLYGKFAASKNSSFKIPFLSEEDGTIKMVQQEEEDSNPGYIPIGSAIISESRVFTIRACQANFHKEKPGFCYCDTDSVHVDCPLEDVKGIVIAKNTLNTFKHESSWDTAIFDNTKRYIEHIIEEDNEEVDAYYNITCAGMPDKAKLILRKSLGDNLSEGEEKIIEKEMKKNEEVINFLSKNRQLTDFKKGLKVPGKLMKKTIKGGVILYDDFFTIRN